MPNYNKNCEVCGAILTIPSWKKCNSCTMKVKKPKKMTAEDRKFHKK